MSVADALAHLRAGRPQAAVTLLAARVDSHPADADAWFFLGASRHALNDLAGAESAFSRSLELNPGNAEAHLAHVTVLRALRQPHAALDAARGAFDRFPNDVRTVYAVALCLEDLGDDERALAYYDRSLAISSAFADALHNRTLLLARGGRIEEARTNQLRYTAAHPGDTRAQLGLADICLALGQFTDALSAIDVAEKLSPGAVGNLLRRGAALACLRNFAESRDCFARARDIDAGAVTEFVQRIAPGSSTEFMLSPENLFFWQCQLAFQRCDWTSWSICAEELRRLPSTPEVTVEPAVSFISFHLPLSGHERLALAKHVATRIEAESRPLPMNLERRSGRVRIGVLSPDFREHLNAYLLLPLFELLDRRHFLLYAYSLASDDGSAIRSTLTEAADEFRDLHEYSDEDAARAIHADEIDVLIDAAGHTTGGRFGITARHPGRVQALYLGFAGSIGSARVEYAISDQVVWGGQSEWTESPAFLPQSYFMYDFRNPVPELPISRQDYGLPSESFIYCAFHKAEKISPDAFALWMNVLREVPRSVLWLLALPPAAQHNLTREAERLGVAPSRLHFAPFDPRERYLARQQLGDLMLDAIHHSAMTTACDAMAAGLPVLTLSGNAMASRAGESLARAAGLPELVAPDGKAFVELAVSLAHDRPALERIRGVLLARTGSLFDTHSRVRELESVFLEILKPRGRLA